MSKLELACELAQEPNERYTICFYSWPSPLHCKDSLCPPSMCAAATTGHTHETPSTASLQGHCLCLIGDHER
jgi:hypothetical protein